MACGKMDKDPKKSTIRGDYRCIGWVLDTYCCIHVILVLTNNIVLPYLWRIHEIAIEVVKHLIEIRLLNARSSIL